MKDHELLNLIGDVSEGYVQAADETVVRPKFRWKALAACAACAALVAGAYLAAHPPLHDYMVLEDCALATLDDIKASARGQLDAPEQAPLAPEPDQPPRGNGPEPVQGGGDQGSGVDGDSYWQDEQPIGDVSVDEAASNQYDRLLRGMGMHGEGAADYPGWFAGAWIDHGGYYDSPAVLTVAIVDSLRTPELEAEITGWCGAGVVFQSAKYSHGFLDGLMDPVTKALDGTGLDCGIGVDVVSNCLGVDIYSSGEPIPDTVLAQLARLDPEGDAIRVRLFTGKLDTLTDEIKKGPAPEPVAPEARATPTVDADGGPVPTPTPIDESVPVYRGAGAPADAVPGGAYAEDLPQSKEASQPAQYDLLPLDE